MAVSEPRQVLYTCADGSWSVCSDDRRLVFLNGASAMEIPVEGPLRWCRDGVEEMTFDRALETAPAELHGWMTVAAVIALRHCLEGLVSGLALPVGYHEWARLAGRAERACAWMHVLARLDGIDAPPLPDGVDDGLDEPYDRDPAAH